MQKQSTIYFLLTICIFVFCNQAFAQDTLLKTPLSHVVKQDSLDLKTDSLHILSDSVSVDTIIKPQSSNNSKAIESQVLYSSEDSIVFDISTKEVFTYGSGNVKYDDINLSSEIIRLDLERSEVFAKGSLDSLNNEIGMPVYKDATETFDSDSIKYNFRTKQGLVYGVKTQQDEGYLHGEKTKMHENREIHIHQGKYTTCDADCPHFYLKITKGKFIPNDKLLFGPAWLVVDEIPIPIVLPFGFFPNKKGRTNGILFPTVGEEINKGFYFRDFGFYFGFSDYFDIRITGDVYTLGSWRSSVQSNYVSRYKFNGNVELSYASLVLDEMRQSPQFQVRWSHSQNPKTMGGANFSASVNYSTVGFNSQNSDDADEIFNNEIGSSISFSKKFNGTPFSFSTTVSHNQNNSDSTIYLTLPDMRLSMSSITPFKAKKGKQRFYNKISLSYTGNFKNKLSGAKLDSTFYTKETFNAFQKAINHTIPVSTSMTILKYFTLSPSFNYQERWYFEKLKREWDDEAERIENGDTLLGNVVETREQGFNRVYNYSASVSLRTNIYGNYEFRSRHLKAIRHVITPTVSYQWTPDFSDEKYGYYSDYKKNEAGDISRYSYYEDGMFGVPSSYKQNNISFSIRSNLEAKVRDAKDTVTGFKKIKLIENLTVSGSYNFALDSNNLSLIKVSGSTNLFEKLRLSYSSTLDPYALIRKDENSTETVRSSNYLVDKYGRLWRKTDDKWAASLSYTFSSKKDGKTDAERKEMYRLPYEYWDVPWKLNLSYTLSVPRTRYFNYVNELDSISTNLKNSLELKFDFQLTDKWDIGFKTGWDLVENEITHKTLSITRDLHCWQMSFNYNDFGYRKFWDFTIRVKADMLSDLKYNMRSADPYF